MSIRKNAFAKHDARSGGAREGTRKNAGARFGNGGRATSEGEHVQRIGIARVVDYFRELVGRARLASGLLEENVQGAGVALECRGIGKGYTEYIHLGAIHIGRQKGPGLASNCIAGNLVAARAEGGRSSWVVFFGAAEGAHEQ